MSSHNYIKAWMACGKLHQLHAEIFKPKFDLKDVCGLAVPAGASLNDIELADLFNDQGLDRICMPAHEAGLARFPLGDTDLLVFAYDGDPLEIPDRITVPQWTLGYIYSNLSPVSATHEEVAAFGGDPFALVTALYTEQHVSLLTSGASPIIIPIRRSPGFPADRLSVDI